jgi:hypothetical protein
MSIHHPLPGSTSIHVLTRAKAQLGDESRADIVINLTSRAKAITKMANQMKAKQVSSPTGLLLAHA